MNSDIKETLATLPATIARITRTLYFFIGFFVLSIIIFDSGNLITRDAVLNRWTFATVLLAINTAVWYLGARKYRTNFRPQAILITILALVLLVFAGFTTYWERGMASTSTIFYALPLLTIVTLKNRRALLSFAVLASGTYSFASVKYFNDFFNEGYRVQLWGHLLLYSGTIFVMAWLLMITANIRRDSE